MQCYQCGNETPQLSNRSRCIECESSRASFNEKDNDVLRQQLGDAQCMITAFRHAANSLGKATGVIISHVEHDEAAKSVTGDHYFLELIAESELRYKRLKAAADAVVEGVCPGTWRIVERNVDVVSVPVDSFNQLEEVLK